MSLLKKKFLKYQAQTTPHPMGLEIYRARGLYLYDADNNAYLDFIAGVSACSLGHCHPKVVEAIEKQVRCYMHVMAYGEFALKPAVTLCEELVELLPENHETVYLTNSGTEAVEGALKLSKRTTGRSELIGAKYAYHGSTQGTLSLLGLERQKKAYRPLLPGTRFIRFNNEEDIGLITKKTAAVLLETIQGGAGFVLPENDYLKKVKQRCEEVGALLILDEIQPGFGRTGKFFGFEHFGVSPDILVMGKAMGGGLPVGAFSSSKEIMRKFEEHPKLGHITTFGGNPVIASACLATLREIRDSRLMDLIPHKEQLFRSELKHRKIKRIQGKGLMLALILRSPEEATALILKCLEERLLLFWLLWRKDAVRISPPLTISDEEIVAGCSVIKKVLDRI